MKTRNHEFLLALAVIAMAVVGWNLGGNSGGKTSVASPPANTRSSRPERLARIRPGPSGEAAQRLEAIRAATNPAERMRATIDLANTLSSAEFANWLDGGWFTLRGSMESAVFTQILMERWRKEDPEGFLVWGLKNDSDAAKPLLTTWAETEPQRVLDFFKSHPNDLREMDLLDEIAAKNPALALHRLQEMAAAGLSKQVAYRAENVLRELAKQSPDALEAVIDTLPSSLKSEAEESVIRVKMQDSFASELRKLWARPDGVEVLMGILGRSEPLKGKLVDELANLPASWREQIASRASNFVRAEDAAKCAAADLEGFGFTTEQAKEIRIAAISHLAYLEPETALNVMAELDLSSDQKKGMLNSIFRYLRHEPEMAETLLARLGSDEERQIARDALQPPPDAKPEIKPIGQPAEWLATVTAPDAGEDVKSSCFDMLDNWGPEKSAALVTGFQSLPEDKKLNLAKLIYEDGDVWASPLGGEAAAYLVAHPSDQPDEIGTSQVIELASYYVVELAELNPGKAGEWIQSLPDGEAKFYAAKNLQSVWSLYDPEAAERWMNTLPAATREKVRSLGK